MHHLIYSMKNPSSIYITERDLSLCTKNHKKGCDEFVLKVVHHVLVQALDSVLQLLLVQYYEENGWPFLL
jgi:hypothetical protein